MTQPVIMWFRQDLRTDGHPALTAAAAAGPVLPLYILDDDTPGRWRWGGASRWWLHQSLAALGRDLPLVLRRGPAEAVLADAIRESGAEALYFTRGYGPWEGALESRVKALCDGLGVACHRYGGFLLHEPEAIRSGSGEPYRVYTPFSRTCFAVGEPKIPVKAPIVAFSEPISGLSLDALGLQPTKPDWADGLAATWTPGEAGAHRRLAAFVDDGLAGYALHRDRPDLTVTSGLSAHLHWGEISPARCWHAVRSAMAAAGGRLDLAGEKFLKEVLWREFSFHLLHHWPSLPEKPFKPEFAAFPWADDPKGLKTWQRGMTGYPIVDAGMRELWATGIMHNRVRMIAASFLIKDLLVPWQTGAAWFWDTLVDADIASNSASWQWVAGSGADAAPYFRIFNPVLQGEKFDPDGQYVRKWVPELARMPQAFVHRPWEAPILVRREAGALAYPAPIIDHRMARDRALSALKSIKSVST